MKKILKLISVLFISLILSSCYFRVTSKDDYKIIENSYYLFDDMETLKTVIIPMINKTFTEWHWYDEKFDEKYDLYYGNISSDFKSKSYMKQEDYSYCVYLGKGSATTKDQVPYHISGSYFQITERETGISTVFFKN